MSPSRKLLIVFAAMFMKYIKAVKKTGIIWLVASAAIILAAIGAGALTVLWREHTKPAQKAAVAPVAPVLGPDVSLEGKIQALRVVEVPAPVEGTVDVFHVDIGQEIFEGQLLAQIHSDSLTGAEEHATQLADHARNRLNDLEASII